MRILVWTIQFPIVAVFAFYFFSKMAVAPRFHQPEVDHVERSIASLQERFFDQRLKHYEYCYGVNFVDSENVEANRRRACKAMLVHQLDKVLGKPGSYLTSSLQFRCQGTGSGLSKWETWRAQPVFVLKPNFEMRIIREALEKNYAVSSDEVAWNQAQNLCTRMQECQKATRPDTFSWRKLKSCMVTLNNEMRRVVLVDLVSNLFRTKPNRLLVAQIINQYK